ncbi:MAG: hypothetical protein OEZ13_01030 [Spirochaetia bacterium]|nr:hypothetical protein [Spirochaetia bacterium]
MKRRLTLLTIFIFFSLFSQACLYQSRRIAGYEPNVRPLKENKEYEFLGKSEAAASNYNLFWLFSVTPLPDLDRAIEDAVQKKNGDELIDVSWENITQYWLMGTVNIMRIKGKVIKYKN